MSCRCQPIGQGFEDGWDSYDAERDGAPILPFTPIPLRRWEIEQTSVRKITAAARARWPTLWALEDTDGTPEIYS